MENKINQLISEIKSAFLNVSLNDGISWHEAQVLDNYGSIEERVAARKLDEKEDWTKIPFSLIGDLRYQDIMPFLDTKGLKFYLPACMIYAIQNYKESPSLIVHSTIYTLVTENVVHELKPILNMEQKKCIIHFLSLCLEIGEDYFDLNKVEKRLHQYLVEPTKN